MISTLARPFAGEIHWPILLPLSALFCLAPAKASAQQLPGLTVHWEAPARCPQQSEVTERVRKLSGSPTSAQGALQADGTITQTDDGRFHLKLILRSGELIGQRSIDSRSCADLTRAAAVAIALLLHSDESLGEAAPSTDHATSGAHEGTESPNDAQAPEKDRAEPALIPSVSPPKQSPPPAPERKPVSAATEGLPAHVRLMAPLAALSIGPLPRPAWGISLALGASYGRWSVWFQGAEWQAQTVPSTDFPGYGGNVKRATASFKACGASRFSVFEVAPCVGVSFEHARAAGVGSNVAPESQQINWWAPGAGAQARGYFSRWFAMTLSVDGIIETSRPRFSISGVGLVRQVAPVAATVMLGPEWIL